MLVLDIDYFEAVNDNYGHDAGDSVLRQFASRVRRNIRGIDLACRLGGEEFVVVMPDTDLAKAYLVGERLRHALQRRRSMLARGSARWKSRQASALPHSNSPRTRPNSPSSVRTKRSIAPSAMDAIASWPTPRSGKAEGSRESL